MLDTLLRITGNEYWRFIFNFFKICDLQKYIKLQKIIVAWNFVGKLKSTKRKSKTFEVAIR